MNDESLDNQQRGRPLPADNAGETATEYSQELLGAVDIVEAFTSLRHELKLQVRSGRELQQSLHDSLQRIEQRLASQQAHTGASSLSDESRPLAEAVTEIEESLERTLGTLTRQSPPPCALVNLLDRFDHAATRASWTARRFAGSLLEEVREIIAQSASQSRERDEALDSAHRGLELLHARVHRLMQQCDIRRVDVLHQPFDAEVMHAVDLIDAPSVPSSHVAQQLRPAYVWRGTILRYADVRLAK
jgi:hypothetical protein